MKNQNPYGGATVVLANGDPVTELRRGGKGERLHSESTGEFNAGSRKELISVISEAMAAASSGRVVRNTGYRLSSESSADRRAAAQERKEVLARALSDDKEWSALGADIAVQITEARDRMGFMPVLAMPQNLNDGDLPRVIVQTYEAMAVVATGPTDLAWQLIRNKNFHPAEFEIKTHVRAENIELRQGGGDMLDQLYNQGLDSQMVQQDRIWKASADMASTVNPIEYISGMLSPQMLARIGNGVRSWNLPATRMIFSTDYWEDISGNPDFAAYFDPTMKYDLAYNGILGHLNGMELMTDGFRTPNQRVLDRGDLYVVSAPEHHACYSDRGGIVSTPVDGAPQGNTTRGWFMYQTMSFTLANPRSVQRAKRA